MYRGIAFEGGGVTGISHIGVLEVLEDQKIYSQLTHFAGSSAGAIIAALAACRTSLKQMKEVMLKLKFAQFEDSSWSTLYDVYRFVREYGWNSNGDIEKTVIDVLKEITGDGTITMDGVLKRYGSTLIITTTNVETAKTEYLSPVTHPTMTVAHAITLTSCLPVIYPPVNENGTLYTDGGLTNNYPIRALYHYLPPEHVIGVKLVSDEDVNRDSGKPHNVISYYRRIIEIMHNQNLKAHVHKEDWNRTIKVSVGQISVADFKLTDLQKTFLVDQGRIAAIKWFTETSHVADREFGC